MSKTLKLVGDSGFTLGDTTQKMISVDYKERFRAEYWQTALRYHGLKKMLKKWRKGVLDFTPTTPRYMLEEQLKDMRKYLKILEARAEIEGIDLERDIDE